MNRIVTSKEEILEVSRSLLQREGFRGINIRALAKECGISIGSIYNYFENKSDLLNATVESIWYDIFHFSEEATSFAHFTDCIQWLFDCMKSGEEKYPGFFAYHSSIFMENERKEGQERMSQSWLHINQCLYHFLMHDPDVSVEVFDAEFTSKRFIEIIFSLMIGAMIRHDYDCSGIVAMIRRAIYNN